ncbi:MAG: hypothetical protein QNJ64_13705 [Crocosphaera sp.]|nr:hypothetical protein [Crocosphaera sp.]
MVSCNIAIIGPRASGKTTYLAALLHHAEKKMLTNKKSSYTVTAQTLEARQLQRAAEQLLKGGVELEPTKLGYNIQTVYDLPFYSFTIERNISVFNKLFNVVNGLFNHKRISEKFQITTRDYPGEIFDDLAESNLLGDDKEAFVKDCFDDKRGGLMMLAAWKSGSDIYYHSLLNNFLHIMNLTGNTEDYKMAVVMSKCERIELWPGRLNPEFDLFEVHLPKTRALLRKYLPSENLKFYAISSFGVLGENDPRPNRMNINQYGLVESVLRETSKWQPYNIVEPLYWLSTGK